MIRLVLAVTIMTLLSGCVTMTAPPREQNVVYTDTEATNINPLLENSISIGEVSEFPGTSIITLAGRLSPNLSNSTFTSYLNESLSNAGLLGEGYVLNAELIESNDWSDWGHSLGKLNRNIEIEYTLIDQDNKVIFSEIIIGNGEISNYNPLHPFYMLQRQAAEKGYSDNIRQLIARLREVDI